MGNRKVTVNKVWLINTIKKAHAEGKLRRGQWVTNDGQKCQTCAVGALFARLAPVSKLEQTWDLDRWVRVVVRREGHYEDSCDVYPDAEDARITQKLIKGKHYLSALSRVFERAADGAGLGAGVEAALKLIKESFPNKITLDLNGFKKFNDAVK